MSCSAVKSLRKRLPKVAMNSSAAKNDIITVSSSGRDAHMRGFQTREAIKWRVASVFSCSHRYTLSSSIAYPSWCIHLSWQPTLQRLIPGSLLSRIRASTSTPDTTTFLGINHSQSSVMLLTELILSKDNVLSQVWIAAHYERKLSKQQALKISVEDSVRRYRVESSKGAVTNAAPSSQRIS